MQLDILVARFSKKDELAFEVLYTMYSKAICAVILSIVKDEERSKEICQDVFIKAWENAHTYNSSKGRFFTWILNIARNAAIDETRSKTFKNLKKNLSLDYFVNTLEDTSESHKADSHGLRQLIGNLKGKCIQLIELLYFRGYTQKEAAEELEIPLGTVKTRNRSCITQLRDNCNKN